MPERVLEASIADSPPQHGQQLQCVRQHKPHPDLAIRRTLQKFLADFAAVEAHPAVVRSTEEGETSKSPLAVSHTASPEDVMDLCSTLLRVVDQHQIQIQRCDSSGSMSKLQSSSSDSTSTFGLSNTARPAPGGSPATPDSLSTTSYEQNEVSIREGTVCTRGDDIPGRSTLAPPASALHEVSTETAVFESPKSPELEYTDPLFQFVGDSPGSPTEVNQGRTASPNSKTSVSSNSTTKTTFLPPADSFSFGNSSSKLIKTSATSESSMTSGSTVRKVFPRPNSTASLASVRTVEEYTGTTMIKDDGTATVGNFEIIAEIGRGSYGTVVLAVPENGDQPVAIKTMYRKAISRKRQLPRCRRGSRTEGGRPASAETAGSVLQPDTVAEAHPIEREIALMKRLRHKNLVRLHAVIEDEADQQCHLVMQYIENGPIAKLSSDGTCEPLPPGEVIGYMVQVSAGLDYLHRRGILHRDVKPENILVDQNYNAYLADFGVSSFVEDVDSSSDGLTQAGTPAFFSPELCKDNRSALMYGAESDVWAFGVTLYVLLYGKLPFNGWNPRVLMSAIMEEPLSVPDVPSVPSYLKQAIQQLLEKNPEKRMTLTSFRQLVARHASQPCSPCLSSTKEMPSFMPTDSSEVSSGGQRSGGVEQILASAVGDPGPGPGPMFYCVDEEATADEPIVLDELEIKNSVSRRRVSFDHVGPSGSRQRRARHGRGGSSVTSVNTLDMFSSGASLPPSVPGSPHIPLVHPPSRYVRALKERMNAAGVPGATFSTPNE